MFIDMKILKKIILTIFLIVFLGFTIFRILQKRSFGNVKKEYAVSQNLKGPNFAPQGVTNDINQSWDHIELGDEYFKSQNYKSAAAEFEMAYDTTYGSKSLSGLKLAESYEKLGRFDDAINLLDQMIIKKQLSQAGIQMANDFKERLLVAKSQALQNQP